MSPSSLVCIIFASAHAYTAGSSSDALARLELFLAWAFEASVYRIRLLASETVRWTYVIEPDFADMAIADFNSVFSAGVNVAATWDRNLARAQGQAMGAEHQMKGVDVQLGPVAGPLGRSPEGGRNWEGFRCVASPALVLTSMLTMFPALTQS